MRTPMILLVALGLSSGCRSDFNVDEIPKRLGITALLVDVGPVPLGETVDFTLQLDVLSGSAIEIRAVSILAVQGEPDAFTWDGVAPLVPTNEAAFLGMTYAPVDVGYQMSVVTITSDSADPQLDVTVRGQGVLPRAEVWPYVLDFGPQEVGDSVTKSVTVVNDRSLPMVVEGATIDAPFSVATTLPLTIGPNSDKDIDVQFDVADAEEAVGELEFDVGEFMDVSTVTVWGNACSLGMPALYDADSDGFTVCAGDCDDNDAAVNPGRPETFDLVDQDCDGIVDEGTVGYDDDGDGYTELQGDCNDADSAVNRDATETDGNGIDDDCDGVVDTGSDDLDSDGYGPDGGDCDDTDRDTYPGAPELVDGVDNDCDGFVDEDTVLSDDDGDGYCESTVSCIDGSIPGDCDDTSSTADITHPGAPEIADWLDNDCDGTVDENTNNDDTDGDGFNEVSGDCDDANPLVSPSRPEIPGNGIDDDCDSSTAD